MIMIYKIDKEDLKNKKINKKKNKEKQEMDIIHLKLIITQ